MTAQITSLNRHHPRVQLLQRRRMSERKPTERRNVFLLTIQLRARSGDNNRRPQFILGLEAIDFFPNDGEALP